MALGMRRGGSHYLGDLSARPARLVGQSRARFLRSFSPAKLFLRFTALAMALLVLGSGLQLTVLADAIRSASAIERPNVGNSGEDNGEAQGTQTMKDAMEAAGFDPNSQADMERYARQTRKPANPNSFEALFYRLLVPQYINETPQGLSIIDSGRKAGCDDPRVGQGTVVYHNCDVPNISGEIVQDVVRFLFPSGAYGAAQQSAKSIAPSFGLPTGILPGNGEVPVSETARTHKYTALELFGYNLNYTAYLGEWDYIKVFTEARAMSNFGVFDNLKLGGKAVIDGAVNAVGNGVAGWTSGFNSGGLAGAIGGFFSGAFQGGVAGSINTILDTSDLNVFEQQAWYRPDFGATTYGARSLNSTELSAESLRWMNSMMNYYQPNKGVIPADFPLKDRLPPRPLEAISSCDVIADRDGNLRAWGQRSAPPGVLEADCRAEGDRLKAELQAQVNAETAEYNSNLEEGQSPRTTPQITAPSYRWDEDGTRPQESIASWSSTHSGFLAGMTKYGWSCGLPSEGSAAARAGSIDAWYSCFNSSYDANYQKALDAEKIKENNKYTDSIFGKFAGLFAGFYAAQNQDQNFNAAYNRFVCQDPSTGNTIVDGSGRYARVYKSDGGLTGSCPAIRAPIQNGLLGNGYNASQGQPAVDTRRAEFSPIESIGTAFGNTAASMSLQVSIFATQLSNTILGLAFTPVLDALGLRDIVVSLIESFRDSMFMPLAVLMIALGAITIFWNAIRNGAYASAFTSFLYIAAAFLLGVILLAKPAATLKFVDEAPVMVESTILSVMFNGISTDDPLCTTSGSTVVAPGGKQLDGSSGFNPQGAIRTLMCENWRSFAFTPWVFGQWGTGYENLYANGYAPADGRSLTNTNQGLVGNAGVNLGGGSVLHNWATYQLAVTSVGTSTTADPARPTGVVNKNFYRIVDAQMGPNNGAGTDPTYAKSWSKFNGDTAAVAVLGPISSIMGAVVVIGYTIAKLELVFVTIFLLIALPIMLLIGIHPTFGRQKLKAYGGTLLGLMIQRVFLTILIGLLFKFMFSISASGASYLIIAIVSIVIAAIFIAYRKELLGLVQKAMDEAAGSFAGGQLYDARRQIAERVPVGVRNFASMKKQEARGMAFGAVAAVRHGQRPWEIPGTLKSIRESYSQRESAAQMMTGLGGSQKANRVKQGVDKKLNSRFNRSSEFESARTALLGASGLGEDSRFDDEGNLVTKIYQTDNPEGRPTDDEGRVLNDKGEPIVIGEEVERTALGRKKSLNGRAVRRNMVKQNRLKEKLENLEGRKTRRIVRGEKRAMKRMGYEDISSLTGAERAQAQAARARVHLNMTRYAQNDGREFDPQSNPLEANRRGAALERRRIRTESALQGTVASGVDSGRFESNSERSKQVREAYGELKGLMDQAAQDVDKTFKISQGRDALVDRAVEAADSLERRVTDGARRADEAFGAMALEVEAAARRFMGKDDDDDLFGGGSLGGKIDG